MPNSAIRIVTLAVVATLLLVADVRADDISAKSIAIKDNANPARRTVLVQSSDAGVAFADADAPDINGAWVHVYSDTDDHCSYLAPGLDWAASSAAWKYRNKLTKDQALLQDGRLLIKIRSAVTFTLADNLSQGAVQVQVQFGDAGSRYCMSCQAPIKDDAKMFRAKDCVAAPCAPEPSLCGPTPPAVCGNLTVEAGEECEVDGDCSGGQLCTTGCLCATDHHCGDGTVDPGEECEVDGDCSGGEVCTDRCFCVDPQCPASIVWTQHAGIGAMTTSTDLDLGTSGFHHNADRSDAARLVLAVSQAVESTPASCGAVTIGGIDPKAGNCRCQSDNRKRCDEPFANDVDDCGGGLCTCYLSPPEPAIVGGTPVCIVRRLTANITGTWNVDSGAANLTIPQHLSHYTGLSGLAPCPTCIGDAVANDGTPGGTCGGGDNAGLSCDANGTDASFPAPGGGSTSYDCLPSSFSIVGGGLEFDERLTTGIVSLPSTLPCGTGLTGTCPCGICSGNDSIGCATNADCLAPGAGHCVGDSNYYSYANSCDGGLCTDLGGGQGYCAAGPVDDFCDGFTKANGDGIFACDGNSACSVAVIGIDAGTCNLHQPRSCFLTPIVASGTANAGNPVLAGATCLPRSSNSTVNVVVGLPGAMRERLAMTTSFPCSGAPASNYPACP